jgi:hypothetical protein
MSAANLRSAGEPSSTCSHMHTGHVRRTAEENFSAHPLETRLRPDPASHTWWQDESARVVEPKAEGMNRIARIEGNDVGHHAVKWYTRPWPRVRPGRVGPGGRLREAAGGCQAATRGISGHFGHLPTLPGHLIARPAPAAPVAGIGPEEAQLLATAAQAIGQTEGTDGPTVDVGADIGGGWPHVAAVDTARESREASRGRPALF